MAQATSGSLKGKLLKHAIDTKVANFRKDGSVTHAVYDRVVFSKVRLSARARARPHPLLLLPTAVVLSVPLALGLTPTPSSCEHPP